MLEHNLLNHDYHEIPWLSLLWKCWLLAELKARFYVDFSWVQSLLPHITLKDKFKQMSPSWLSFHSLLVVSLISCDWVQALEPWLPPRHATFFFSFPFLSFANYHMSAFLTNACLVWITFWIIVLKFLSRYILSRESIDFHWAQRFDVFVNYGLLQQ